MFSSIVELLLNSRIPDLFPFGSLKYTLKKSFAILEANKDIIILGKDFYMCICPHKMDWSHQQKYKSRGKYQTVVSSVSPLREIYGMEDLWEVNSSL